MGYLADIILNRTTTFWGSFDLDKVCFYSEKLKWIKAAGNIWVLKGKQGQKVLGCF